MSDTPDDVADQLEFNPNQPAIVLLPGDGTALLVQDQATGLTTGWSPTTRAVMIARLRATIGLLRKETP